MRICSTPAILFVVALCALGNMCKSTGYDLSGRSHSFITSFVAWLHFDNVKSLLSNNQNHLNYKEFTVYNMRPCDGSAMLDYLKVYAKKKKMDNGGK